MPKGFQIDRKKLAKDILISQEGNFDFPFSKTWDMLNTYIRDHFKLNFKIDLINKKTWGYSYKDKGASFPLLEADPVDYKNSPDFTLLYGVKVDSCWLKIYYDDNRRKNRSWDIELKNNQFIMFPSTNMYVISSKQEDSPNIIQTITYEYSG